MKNEHAHNGVQAVTPHDPRFLDILTDMVLWCADDGTITYANTRAQSWSLTHLAGQPLVSLLLPDSTGKGERFFEAARRASPQQPTPPWELMLGTSEHYTSAQFYGYHDTDHIVIVGHAEPAHVGRMQQELVDLTSELAETHRQIRRQNQALQKALDEQHQLLDTIQQLTMPAVPIWERVLLLPLVGYIDSQRAERITSQLLERVSTARAHYVILDVSAIADIDTAVARHLIGTAQALRLLGARPVLVGISPELAETVTTLGIGLHEFVVQSDLQHAVAYVLRRLRKG